MKTAIIAFAVATCLLAAIATPVLGAWSNTITVTVTASGDYTITVNQSAWGIGTVAYGSGEYTTSTSEFRVTNNGTAPVDVEIKLANPTVWTQMDAWGGGPDEDEFMMNATDPTDTYATATTAVNGIDTTDSSGFIDGLAPTDSNDIALFGLEFYMPPSGTTLSEQSITVTLTGSADT